MSKHTIMRRSTRIRWQIPIQITSLDARCPFNETCETVAVNAHGCGVICHVPLDKGIPVKVGLLPDNREVMAHIADVVKLGEDGRAWLLGVQLDLPANVWGVRNPPHDWDQGNTGLEGKAADAPRAASAAAGAGASGTAVATATLAAPEFSVVTPAPPASPPVAVQRAAVSDQPKVEVAKPAGAGNSNGISGQRATDVGRSQGEQQPAARLTYNVRDRDWAELRRQMEEHLQDLMWQVDDQVETKLEHWKEQMVDAEARLESLCQLQDRLQAHITVLSEIVKEKVKPEAEGSAPAGPSGAGETKMDAAATAESVAATASQVEEIRQLQQWMQSLIHLLPQAVEQHANEAVGSAEQRLHTQAEEQFAGMRKQLAELQQRLDAEAAAQALPDKLSAAEEERRKASEDMLRAASQEIQESLQKSLREESEKLQQELGRAQQAAQEEAERRHKLQEEAAAHALQRSDEAGQKIEQLRAAETTVREMGDQVRKELRAALQAALEAQNQQIGQAAAALEEKSSRLQAQISEFTTARENGEQLGATLQGQLLAQKQQIEHATALLEEKSSRLQAQISEFNTVHVSGEQLRAELRSTLQGQLDAQKQQMQQAAAQLEEKSSRLQAQVSELTASTEEARRAREALESVVASLTQAACQQIKEDVGTALQTIASEAKQQAERWEKEFAEKTAEAQRLGTAAQEQLAELAKQAGNLSQRLEEGERSRESLQSVLDSAIAACEEKVESSAAVIFKQVGRQSEEQL
ncbi:MAG TPA: hypothetical protein VGR48_13595, partial [Terriglobales bacterium]|nr:hypothetical protein [Terriglobales bacterium]